MCCSSIYAEDLPKMLLNSGSKIQTLGSEVNPKFQLKHQKIEQQARKIKSLLFSFFPLQFGADGEDRAIWSKISKTSRSKTTKIRLVIQMIVIFFDQQSRRCRAISWSKNQEHKIMTLLWSKIYFSKWSNLLIWIRDLFNF